MIINHLSEIMGRKRLKPADVVRMTGLARNTVVELYHARAKRVDLETLDRLCTALDCQIGEILEYKEDDDGLH